MAETNNSVFRPPLRNFPPVIDGRINIVEFLDAASDVVNMLQRLGIAFMPATTDVRRNVNKIKNCSYQPDSCLLELLREERSRGEFDAIEGCLWFNRALSNIEIMFDEIRKQLQANIQPEDVDMEQVFTTAYDGSLRQYHNALTQQLFLIIIKMAPNLPQFYKALNITNHENEFKDSLDGFIESIRSVRCTINNLFDSTNVLEGLLSEGSRQDTLKVQFS